MGNEGSHQLKYGEKVENDIQITWTKESHNIGAGRDGHCACSVEDRVYLFGGVKQTDDGRAEESNEMITYTPGNVYTTLNCSGVIPALRSAATMASVGTEIYLFGGLSQESGWFDDVHVFHTSSNTWEKLAPSGKGPSPRDKLQCAVIGNKIYIFGGFGPQGTEEDVEEVEEFSEEEEEDVEEEEGVQFGWFNDLYVFDTSNQSWSSPMQKNLGVPTARAAHGMCAVDKYLVIFGGRDTEARRNDLHIFDTESFKWLMDLEKFVQGREPQPRSFHTMTTVGSRLIVLGGRSIDNSHFADCHIFDTKTREWFQPKVEGDVLPARGVHTATVVADKLIVCGGSSDFNTEIMQCTKYHADIYSIKTVDVVTGQSLANCSEENQENIKVDHNVPNEKHQGLATANVALDHQST